MRLGMGGTRRPVARRIVSILQCAVVRRWHGERAEVGARYVVGHKAGWTKAVIENFHLNLASVRMPGQRQLNAQLRRTIESVGIMREQNVWHIAANQRSKIGKHLQAVATGTTLALVVDAKEIKLGAVKCELRIFVAKQLHARLCKEVLCGVFSPSVNFMIAVAPENAERRVKLAYLIDAIGQRVGGSGDEISGDDREVGAELVGHFHRATKIRAAHVAAEVNVAELDDFHAVETGRQIGRGDFDATHAIVETLGGKAVHYAKKRSSTGESRSSTEKVATRRIREDFCGGCSAHQGRRRWVRYCLSQRRTRLRPGI